MLLERVLLVEGENLSNLSLIFLHPIFDVLSVCAKSIKNKQKKHMAD